VKPFLLLATRDHDAAAASEYESVLRVTGLDPGELRWFRLESEPLGDLALDQFSGVIIGGSQYCVSDHDKEQPQPRVEADLRRVVAYALANDFPVLGLCYGVGVIATALGAVVDHESNEDVGAVRLTVTDAGRQDPLLAGVPDVFYAFVGHKEGVGALPPGATLLAAGDDCPIQLFRAGKAVYAAQFHPELDTVQSLADRMEIYQHAGYFAPEEMAGIIARANASQVDGSQALIARNFVTTYAAE
jgi:GMP synthase (glutamine-hydrolysing)